MGTVVKTKFELIALLLSNQERIKQYGVKKLGLFGAFVRDEAKESSGIDFFIEFDPEKKNFDNFMELAFYLQNLLGRKVEIVTPQSLSKYSRSLYF